MRDDMRSKVLLMLHTSQMFVERNTDLIIYFASIKFIILCFII